jgi:hypothetical protein
LPVAAIGGADQIEQRLVFRDRQQRAIAEIPTDWGKVAREQADFAHERL